MIGFIRQVFKYIPTFILAFVLAVTVWIIAITTTDPTEERYFPKTMPVELVGQPSGMIITSGQAPEVSIKLAAPRSIWEQITNEQNPLRVVADLSGLESGTHEIPVQIQVGIQPVRVVSYTPHTFNLTLEALSSQTFQVHLLTKGEPAVGFQAETPVLSQYTVSVSGPESQVKRVKQVRAALDLSGIHENVNRTVNLEAVDIDDNVISSLSLTPDRVSVNQVITQRGGYRNVVVKVVVQGQLANGYRVTNISAFPPAVTVFSTDPKLVNGLPGYIETAPLDISNARDDLDVKMPLNMPAGVSVVGDSLVEVLVGVATIEGSVTLNNMRVEVVGIPAGMSAKLSPEFVDVIISGPLPLLSGLSYKDVRLVVDFHNQSGMGTFQVTPKVELKIPDLRVQSILPGTVEVTVGPAPTQTVTPSVK